MPPFTIGMGIAGLNALGGIANSIFGSANRNRENRLQQRRFEAFNDDIDSMGLNKPIEMGRLDYGHAFSQANRMNQGLSRNAISQLNRQIGGMNHRSRALGIPVNNQAAGHMIGGVYGNIADQNSRTAQGFLGLQQRQNQLQFQADTANRDNSLQYLQMKHFGKPTKPAAGQGWIGAFNALSNAGGNYLSMGSNDALMQALSSKFDVPYESWFNKKLF